MKKRAMKKRIPRNTIYCYETIGYDPEKHVLHTRPCPWHTRRKGKDGHMMAYCTYLRHEEWSPTLDDWCKDCSAHYPKDWR